MGRGVANHPGGDAAARLHQHGVAVRKAAGLALGTLAAYGPGVAAGPGDFAPDLERQSLAGKLDEVRQGAGILRGGLPKWRGEGNHQSLFLLRVAGADLRQGLQVAQPARRRPATTARAPGERRAWASGACRRAMTVVSCGAGRLTSRHGASQEPAAMAARLRPAVLSAGALARHMAAAIAFVTELAERSSHPGNCWCAPAGGPLASLLARSDSLTAPPRGCG